jgi:hypothetical protein
MLIKTPEWMTRFPIPPLPNRTNRVRRVQDRIKAAERSREFWRKWYFATIIATRRGMAQHCGNPACKRKHACVGQMRPVIYSDSEFACTPPCLSVNRNKDYRAALRRAVFDIEWLVHEHGFAKGVRMARRKGRW